MAMMAITTSNSINVNARTRPGKRNFGMKTSLSASQGGKEDTTSRYYCSGACEKTLLLVFSHSLTFSLFSQELFPLSRMK
jgi:hypothetical protein